MLLSLFSLFVFSLSFSHANSFSFFFPLAALPLSQIPGLSPMYPFLLSQKSVSRGSTAPHRSFKLPFKYSNALVVSLPIGTPPQPTDLVIDTGSQLSWIQCHNERNQPKPKTQNPSFDPSLSSSFSLLPCSNPVCKPRIPDFTIPTSCDRNRLCHYSYFYADGTVAEGNLVRERFTFSPSVSSPPVILGCAQASTENRGILGMNTGRLSFVSQAQISKFSYCVPPQTGPGSTGMFYLGDNPNSAHFKYVPLLTFPKSQRSPNLDPLAYTLPMKGIKIAGSLLNISSTFLVPDQSGSGQTIIDSGSQLTFLVDEVYEKVKEAIVRLAGPMMKKGYEYAAVADMCFDGRMAAEVGRRIGDMSFEFTNGMEILVGKGEGLLTEVEKGVKCVGIGRSGRLGMGGNIIGTVHQQNMWVEYDLANRRVGFGAAECRGMK